MVARSLEMNTSHLEAEGYPPRMLTASPSGAGMRGSISKCDEHTGHLSVLSDGQSEVDNWSSAQGHRGRVVPKAGLSFIF